MPSARRICGSSSTTRTRVIGPASSRTTIGEPAARCVLDLDLAAHRLDEPSRDGEAESDAVAPLAVAESLERQEHPVALVRGNAGPAVDDAEVDAAVDARRRRRAAGSHGRLWPIALAITLASARSSSPASAWTRGSVSGTSTLDLGAAWRRGCASAAGIDLVEADGAALTLERAGLEPAHVEQVADEGVEPVGLLVDRGEELVSRLRRPVDVVLEQARHRRLDRRERRAQVVRDGREERGPQLVRRRRGCRRSDASASSSSSCERRRRAPARTPRGSPVVRARSTARPVTTSTCVVVELDRRPSRLSGTRAQSDARASSRPAVVGAVEDARRRRARDVRRRLVEQHRRPAPQPARPASASASARARAAVGRPARRERRRRC